jgi:uncharacterized protein YheU (UPF0270 family)
VIIPYQNLSPEALHGVIEEFVTRDGTDYGLVEATLDQKINDVMRQVKRGDAVIVYDEATQTTNIVRKEDLARDNGSRLD